MGKSFHISENISKTQIVEEIFDALKKNEENQQQSISLETQKKAEKDKDVVQDLKHLNLIKGDEEKKKKKDKEKDNNSGEEDSETDNSNDSDYSKRLDQTNLIDENEFFDDGVEEEVIKGGRLDIEG